jgi:hypothetical protein
MKKRIRIFIPDAGPLISLAMGDALDLLLLLSADVRLILTDVVNYEATHRSEDLDDAKKLKDFLAFNADRIEIESTFFGKLALEDLERKKTRGQSATLPRDAGEISISSLILGLRTFNPGDPTLVLMEDSWFEAMIYSLPGNVHLLSTSAWLDGLQDLGLIQSAAEIRLRIQAKKPSIKFLASIDREAEKIPEGTEWRSSFRPQRP